MLAPRREKRPMPEDTTFLPLEVHAQRQRKELERHKEERLPALHAQIEEEREAIAAMTARWQTRPRREAERRLAALLLDIERLESNAHIDDFERRLAPYIMARSSRPRSGPSSLHKKARPAAGGRCTVDEFVARDSDAHTDNAAIVAEFLSDVKGLPPRTLRTERDSCVRCGCALLLLATRSLLACPSCGGASAYLDATSSSVSYGDEVEFSSFSYKRLNHFNERMMQVQAKEAFDIDENVIRSVMSSLYSKRIRLEDINPRMVRDVLKTMRLRKTYEHLAQITMRITGVRPPAMTPDMEELCRLLFIAVQPAFEKHCPPNRKNFLSYSYVLFKFFQLLGYDEFLSSFSLLKGKDKLAVQDDIFRNICEELQWEFIPSL